MQVASTTTTYDDTSRQPLFSVLMLNDDDTPMEFVVHVLERFFEMDREAAMRIMLDSTATESQSVASMDMRRRKKG